jgi:YVTN family beta-propeller protein
MLVAAPDGRRVYAASLERLAAIDTATNSVVGSLGIGAYPAGLSLSPDARTAYVTELFSIKLDLVDTTTMTARPSRSLFAQNRLGGYGRIAISPDGDSAWVTNGANAVITVVDLGGTQASDVPMDITPADAVFSPDGTTVYVCGCKNFCATGTVEALHAGTQRTTATYTVGPSPYRILLDHTGTRAYTNNLTDGTVSIIDLAAPGAVTTLPVGPEPTGLALSPDGRTLYATSVHTGVVTAIDTTTRTVRNRVSLGGATREIVITPDGGRAYVSTMDSVLVIDTATLRGSIE